MILKEISYAVIEGQAAKVRSLAEEALASGIRPEEILHDGLIPGMTEIGRRFKLNEVIIPDVLMASRAMHAGIYLLRPLLAKETVLTQGRVVLGTVAGDLHDIGKNLVGIFLESAGFELIDIGIDVPPDEFVQAVRRYQPDILAMSALLTTTMPAMPETIQLLIEEGLRDRVKVLVGGGPVTQEFANNIGADAFAFDARRAAEKALELVAEKKGELNHE